MPANKRKKVNHIHVEPLQDVITELVAVDWRLIFSTGSSKQHGRGRVYVVGSFGVCAQEDKIGSEVHMCSIVKIPLCMSCGQSNVCDGCKKLYFAMMDYHMQDVLIGSSGYG